MDRALIPRPNPVHHHTSTISPHRIIRTILPMVIISLTPFPTLPAITRQPQQPIMRLCTGTIFTVATITMK